MGVLNKKVKYDSLKTTKQKEIYNFQKVSAIFVDYGYSVTPLRDDAEFADFVAVPFIRDEKTEPLWVQLKSGFTVRKEYLDKNLYICFFERKEKMWYLYPHDDFYKKYEDKFQKKAKTWDKTHKYEMDFIPSFVKHELDNYKIDQ